MGTRILHRTEGACETVLFWNMSVFYALACLLSILLEQVLEWLPKSEDKVNAVRVHRFGSAAVALVVRTLGWIAAKLTTDFWTAMLDAHHTTHPRLFWCFYAILSQVSSILVEYRASWKHYLIVIQRYSVKRVQAWQHWRVPSLVPQMSLLTQRQGRKVTESSEEDSDSGSEGPDDDM